MFLTIPLGPSNSAAASRATPLYRHGESHPCLPPVVNIPEYAHPSHQQERRAQRHNAGCSFRLGNESELMHELRA